MLEETSEVAEEAKTNWVDAFKALGFPIIVAGVLGAVGAIVGLQISDAERIKDVTEIKDNQDETTKAVESLRVDISDLSKKSATKEYVKESEARAVESSHRYTDQKVTELQPVMKVQTSILERIEKTQDEIRSEQRRTRDKMTDLKLEFRK